MQYYEEIDKIANHLIVLYPYLYLTSDGDKFGNKSDIKEDIKELKYLSYMLSRELYDLCGENVSLKENPWRDNPHMDAVVDALENLPSVTPQQRMGRWERMSDLPNDVDDRFECSHCGNIVHYNNVMDLRTFSRWCGRCGAKMEVE